MKGNVFHSGIEIIEEERLEMERDVLKKSTDIYIAIREKIRRNIK